MEALNDPMHALVSELSLRDDTPNEKPTGPTKGVVPNGGLVDTLDALKSLTAHLLAAKTEIAVDFEGVDLCRDGELCLVQISDGETTWLVDVHVLGRAAFDEDGGGLRELFESTAVMKVGYDGRADADALFHLFGTRLKHFYDVQIASCMRQDAEQDHKDRFVHGLKRAMEAHLTCDRARGRELARIKDEGRKLFAPEKGGSYDVWKERPMPEALARYATSDVSLLLEMKKAWQKYSPVEINCSNAQRRIDKALNANRPAKGRHLALRDFTCLPAYKPLVPHRRTHDDDDEF